MVKTAVHSLFMQLAAEVKNPGPAIPAQPWSAPEQWQEASRTLVHLIRRYRGDLENTTAVARSIQSGLVSIFPSLDRLCIATCSRCPDPCCLTAKPWFDFRDLLFLNLLEARIPPGQPLRNFRATCRYIGPRGCTLPRLARPWICTWYVCPTQTAYLNKNDPPLKKRLDRTLRGIKAGRMDMEAAFLRVIA